MVSANTSPQSSITTNKGFSLVLVQHKEKDFLVAFGGSKKEPSHQVEVLIMEKKMKQALEDISLPLKVQVYIIFDKHSSAAVLTTQPNDPSQRLVNSVARQNLASVIEYGCGRKSLSESLLADSNSLSCNVSLRRQFDNEEDYKTDVRIDKTTEVDGCFPKATDYRINQNDTGNQKNTSGVKIIVEESQLMVSGTSIQQQNQGFGNLVIESDDASFPENSKSEASSPSNICHYYETKVATLIRKHGIVEEQLAAALASREAAEKSLASVLKSRQEMEKKMADTAKEMELLREKLASVQLAQEEANSLSNMVHSDNVRLEHDVAFLKAVLDDTQQELHSTRGVLARERTRAFQLQVEVFHLKQRLQSMENRAPTPMKPFRV